MIIITIILSIGCSQTKSNNPTNSIVNPTNEKIYKVYESYMPQVQAFFNKYEIELEDCSSDQLDYDNKTTFLYYNDETKTKENDIVTGKYVAIIDDDGTISEVNGVIEMVVKNEGFKMEDSIFDELRRIFTDEEIDYTISNAEIKKKLIKLLFCAHLF